MKLANDALGQVGQLLARPADEPLRHGVAILRHLKDQGSQPRAGVQLLQLDAFQQMGRVRHAETFDEGGGEGGGRAALRPCFGDGDDGLHHEFVGPRVFAEPHAAADDAADVVMLVPAPTIVAGSRHQRHAPARFRARHQSDNGVVHHLDGAIQPQGVNSLQGGRQFRGPVIAGHAKARARNLTAVNARGPGRLAQKPPQHQLQSIVPNHFVIAGPGFGKTHHMTMLVGDERMALGAADVNAQEVSGHAVLLSASRRALMPMGVMSSSRSRSPNAGSVSRR